MPRLKLSHVVSFSSEDPNFPANNLLKTENYRKWRCKDVGEKEASVVLQLEKAVKIESIDIGNESSAFAEVLVGRSSQPSDDFKVLLFTSSFMTPVESRNMTNTNRVRMFSSDKLDKNVHGEKWDRVKIVCTQPYNKHVQYGLSFIALHSSAENEEPKPKLLFGGFGLKEDKEEEIKAGSLFAGYRERRGLTTMKAGAAAVQQPSSSDGNSLSKAQSDTKPMLKEAEKRRNLEVDSSLTTQKKPTGAAAIRKASTSEGFSFSKAQSDTKALLKEIEKKRTTEMNTNAVTHKKDAGNNLRSNRKTSSEDADGSESEPENSIAKGLTKNTPVRRKEKVEDSKHPANRARRRSSSPEGEDHLRKKSKKETSKLQKKPFNKLFEGVVFVISGFQNPLRGEIRAKALEMGAKYKPDWDNTCTHLVCAFPNTPKFMQVLGVGLIVSRQWIEDSHAKRRRLPWRRYAMAKHEQGKEESEDEILEESENHNLPVSYSSADRGAPSGSDTDEEIKRCLRESAAPDMSSNSRSFSRNSECYNCETQGENEPEESGENDRLPVPHFPDFFGDHVFYIHPTVDLDTKYELNRHITAFKGKVVGSLADDVTHILVDENMTDTLQPSEKQLKTEIVKINWIWDCNDAGILLPSHKYSAN